MSHQVGTFFFSFFLVDVFSETSTNEGWANMQFYDTCWAKKCCFRIWFARWWFQIFFIFTPSWGRFPIWRIFFRWVETTNQFVFFHCLGYSLSKVLSIFFWEGFGRKVRVGILAFSSYYFAVASSLVPWPISEAQTPHNRRREWREGFGVSAIRGTNAEDQFSGATAVQKRNAHKKGVVKRLKKIVNSWPYRRVLKCFKYTRTYILCRYIPVSKFNNVSVVALGFQLRLITQASWIVFWIKNQTKHMSSDQNPRCLDYVWPILEPAIHPTDSAFCGRRSKDWGDLLEFLFEPSLFNVCVFQTTLFFCTIQK